LQVASETGSGNAAIVIWNVGCKNLIVSENASETASAATEQSEMKINCLRTDRLLFRSGGVLLLLLLWPVSGEEGEFVLPWFPSITTFMLVDFSISAKISNSPSTNPPAARN